MKKLIAFAISVLTLAQLAILPAYAASDRVEANSYEDAVVSGTYSNCVGMNSNDNANYKFTISETGIYDVVIATASDETVLTKTPSFTLTLDGKAYDFSTVLTASWNDYTENKVITGVPLDGGAHRATLAIKSGSANVGYFEFVKTKDFTGTIKQFEDYADGGEGVAYHDTVAGADGSMYPYTKDDVDIGFGGSGKVVAALDTEWIKYDIDVPYTGDYTFEICYAKPDELADMTVDVYPQYGKAVSVKLTGTGEGNDGWQTYKFSDAVNIPLKAGKQTIKLCFGGSAVNLDYFMLTLNEKLYSAVDGVNNAGSCEEIYKIINDNKDLFGDFGEQTSKLFYPQIAMRYLLNEKFECFDDLKAKVCAAIENEVANKSIKLTSNNSEVTDYTTGTLRLQLKNVGLTEKVTFVFAVYDGNKLDYITVKNTNASNDTIRLWDFDYDANKTYTTKCLFWTNDKYSPYTNFTSMVFDENIYVNPEGSDTSSGSVTEPVATIEKAKLLARELTGENRNVNVYVSGKHNIETPITFTADDSAYSGKTVSYIGDVAAEISGGIEVTDWEDYTHNGNAIKRAKVDVDDMRHFYVNGERKQRAKSVLMKATSYWEDSDYVTGEEQYTSWSQGNIDVNPEADGFKLGYDDISSSVVGVEGAELVWDILWATQRTPVKEIKRNWSVLSAGKNSIIKMQQPYFHYLMTGSQRNISPSLQNQFYIENVFAYLDEPGEFYFDKNEKYLYYYPKDGETLKNCYVGVSEGYIDINGTSEKNVSGLTFKGFTFRYGTWLEPNTTGAFTHQSDCLMNEANSSALSKNSKHLFAQVEAVYADNINIIGNKFLNSGSTVIGMREAVSDSSIKNNTIDDVSGSGVMIGSWLQHNSDYENEMTKDITVSDNKVTNVALEYCGSVGIGAYYVQNTEIVHNTIDNTSYTGISLGWGWGNTKGTETYGNKVVGNRITEVMTRLSDGAHIYTLGYLKDCLIAENYCSKSYNTGNGGGGIYHDSGSSYITVKNNVVEDTKYWLFAYNYTSHDITATNNWYKTDTYLADAENITYENNIDCNESGYGEDALNIINNSGVRN